MEDTKQEQGSQDEEDENQASAAKMKQANRAERDGATSPDYKHASGLRSQGAVDVVDAAAVRDGVKTQGRRPEPTRHEANARHKRLAGYGNESDREPGSPVHGSDDEEVPGEDDDEPGPSNQRAADGPETEDENSADGGVFDEDGYRNTKNRKNGEADEILEA